MKITEKDIQDSIIDYLQYQSACYFWRQNAGMAIREHKGKRHVFRSASVDGISDIIGIYQGRPLAIEVKHFPNKPTQNQVNFLEEFARKGGIAMVAYSLDDVMTVLKQVNPTGLRIPTSFFGVFWNREGQK